MFQINLKQGEVTLLRFTLKDATTGLTVNPADLDGGIRFSVFDVDFGSSTAGDETFLVRGWKTALFDSNEPVEAMYSVIDTNPNTLLVEANQLGRGCGMLRFCCVKSLDLP
jgi:hypothetical protein